MTDSVRGPVGGSRMGVAWPLMAGEENSMTTGGTFAVGRIWKVAGRTPGTWPESIDGLEKALVIHELTETVDDFDETSTLGVPLDVLGKVTGVLCAGFATMGLPDAVGVTRKALEELRVGWRLYTVEETSGIRVLLESFNVKDARNVVWLA